MKKVFALILGVFVLTLAQSTIQCPGCAGTGTRIAQWKPSGQAGMLTNGTAGQVLAMNGGATGQEWITVSSPSGANPSATIGLSAVNGSAGTFLRSDGAPALSQAISPTWTGSHTYAAASVLSVASTTATAFTGADVNVSRASAGTAVTHTTSNTAGTNINSTAVEKISAVASYAILQLHSEANGTGDYYLRGYGADGIEFLQGTTVFLNYDGSTKVPVIFNVTDATDATNATTGAAKTAGGFAAAKGIAIGTNLRFGANILASATPPAISSGFGTNATISANNGTAAFRIYVGTGGVASTGVIGLTTATAGWNCFCEDITTHSATVFKCRQTASTTTTASIAQVTTADLAGAWVASDTLAVSCFAY